MQARHAITSSSELKMEELAAYGAADPSQQSHSIPPHLEKPAVKSNHKAPDARKPIQRSPPNDRGSIRYGAPRQTTWLTKSGNCPAMDRARKPPRLWPIRLTGQPRSRAILEIRCV